MSTKANYENNTLIGGNKVLSYPLGLGATNVDNHGNPAQFMMFNIIDTTEATQLRSDKKAGPSLVTNSRVGVGVAATNLREREDDTKGIVDKVVDRYSWKDADPSLSVRYSPIDVNLEKWRLQKGMSRIDKTIILPMPNEHMVGTSVSYDSNYDTPGLTKAGDIINQLGEEGFAGAAGTLIKNKAIGALMNKLKGVGLDTNFRSLMAEDRLAENPRKEVMFNGFTYRQFSFRYQFAPKNIKESNEVNKIIETFRYYALPELDKTKFFYMLPAEWDIAFILGTKDNPNIPKITRSVLQRVGVNYSPNSGVWATLPNGAPVAIDMTLEFLELELVDRNRVWNKNSQITSGY